MSKSSSWKRTSNNTDPSDEVTLPLLPVLVPLSLLSPNDWDSTDGITEHTPLQVPPLLLLLSIESFDRKANERNRNNEEDQEEDRSNGSYNQSSELTLTPLSLSLPSSNESFDGKEDPETENKVSSRKTSSNN